MPEIRFEKLDAGLREAARTMLESDLASTDDAISVSVRFEGAVEALEAVGFQTADVFNHQAMGIIRMRDLGALTALAEVQKVSIGSTRRHDLEDAVPRIRARASSSSLSDGVWHPRPNSMQFDSLGGQGTGAGVIVAVIDTGIDYRHPMFMSRVSLSDTRILRIWDQGLPPATVADGPDPALLISADTYGTEFNARQINDALGASPPLPHRDCYGHGTHVAGIAAGGPQFFAASGNNAKLGVAPEASIIAVKYLDVPDLIQFRNASGLFGVVSPQTRFRDAIMYCLRVARLERKPVVINISLSDYSESGDGLDEDAEWLDQVLDPAAPADDKHFPQGAAVVKSSGNSGGIYPPRTGKVTLPSTATSITVPFELVDVGRGYLNWYQCAHRQYSPSIGIHFWYRRTTPPNAVTIAVRLPHASSFIGDVSPGAPDIVQEFTHIPGPTPIVVHSTAATNTHKVLVTNEEISSVRHPVSGAVIHRNRASVVVYPKSRIGSVTYVPGTYEVRFNAPPGTEIYYCCDSTTWGRSRSALFKTPHPTPAGVTELGEYSSVDPLGRHVITVANYDDSTDHISDSSSRGPLRDFSGAHPATPIAHKPDIAAPGVDISSAASIHSEKGLATDLRPHWNDGVRYARKDGTSMSTPMVAGVIALLLHKDSTLNVTQIRQRLLDHARSGGSHDSSADRQRAYGSGRIDAFESHRDA